MTQHHHQQVADWRGREAVDADGDKLGRVEEVYLDDHTGTPEWLLVKTGFFGSKSTFVPLAGATEEGDLVRVRFSKAQVKDAPGVDADQALTQDEEATLYRHYGLEYAEDRSQSGLPEGEAGEAGAGAGRQAEGQDVSGPNTDDAMTRSEEELRV